jgi:hypothetical protein
MSFLFEFFNIQISHLAQLKMVNIAFKCQKKNICKKIHIFHHNLTWFLTSISIITPLLENKCLVCSNVHAWINLVVMEMNLSWQNMCAYNSFNPCLDIEGFRTHVTHIE